MIIFGVLVLILWILLLLWRINTKTAAMPVKGDEPPSGGQPPAAKEDLRSPHPGEHALSSPLSTSAQNEDSRPQTSSASGGLEVKTAEALQVSSEANSEKSSLPPTPQKPLKTHAPMLSSGPEARERLKFILGASEDNSSDDEPLTTKPPSGAAQPPNHKPCPQQATPAQPRSSSSGIK